ncbi:MAG: hypothetical protein HUK08_00285 [Bacteroidaceae bacterium]|nr:hypothetical protein [Bacteroidaceae bacterium]
MLQSIKALTGKKVIIRCDRAGVFYGVLNEVEECGDKYAVELTQCRRLWCWYGAASLSQMANEGVNQPNKCKFAVVLDSFSVNGVIEILPTTAMAQQSIEGVEVWKV